MSCFICDSTRRTALSISEPQGNDTNANVFYAPASINHAPEDKARTLPDLTPDLLIQPYLHAKTEAEADRHLEALLREHVQPLIQSIVTRKWGVSPSKSHEARQKRNGQKRNGQDQNEMDAEDVSREAVRQIVSRLRLARDAPTSAEIHNLLAYVAVTTFRACDTGLRQKYPQRWALKSRMRYLLKHQAGLALWEGAEGDWLCGFEAWRRENRTIGRSGRIAALIHKPHDFLERVLKGQSAAHCPPGDVVAALLQWVGHPIGLDELVSATAVLWGVTDEPHQTETSGPADGVPVPGGLSILDSQPDPHSGVVEQVLEREYLRRLWDEIRQLPPKQAAALVLNLRDDQGRGVIALLPQLGVASLREIAGVLALSAEQFAEMWKDLPLEDAIIAERLGLTRQQVINLRKVARERLVRRLKVFSG